MDHKRNIIKKINELSGSRSQYDIFCDWVKCMALSIQNTCCIFHDSVWEEREKAYLETIRRFGQDASEVAEMTGMLTMAMDERLGDMLGEIYMESGCGNKNAGQFFTSFSLSCVCAASVLVSWNGEDKIRLNEPSCGAGGMIIAAAKTLKEQGINYQKYMDVVAQDLDWKAVYMCYVQLSLLGIPATVVQGDTLMEPDWRARPRECIFRTPAKILLSNEGRIAR